MSDDNKEGAGVPGCKLGCTDACKAKEHGCASECPSLPWQPAAVMPAAPSDAVIEILALVRSYGDARQDGNDNRAAGWIRDIIAALQAPQPEPAAGEQAGAVAHTELEAACFRWLLKNRLSEDGNGWLRIEYGTARQGKDHKDWAHWLTVDVAGEMGMEVDDLAAPGAAREQEVPCDEDMVNAAYCLHKYRQGTDNGIAFNRGARWMRAALTQPTTVQQAEKGGA